MLKPDLWQSRFFLYGPAVYPPFSFLFWPGFSRKRNLKSDTAPSQNQTWRATVLVPCTTPLQTSNSHQHCQQVTLQRPLMQTRGCIMFIKRVGAWVLKGARCTWVEWCNSEDVPTQQGFWIYHKMELWDTRKVKPERGFYLCNFSRSRTVNLKNGHNSSSQVTSPSVFKVLKVTECFLI